MSPVDLETRLREGMCSVAASTRAVPDVDGVWGRQVDASTAREWRTAGRGPARRIAWCVAAAALAVVVFAALTGRAHATSEDRPVAGPAAVPARLVP